MFASGRYWSSAFDELGREATLVVPDLAGFGRSVDVEVDGYGPDEQPISSPGHCTNSVSPTSP